MKMKSVNFSNFRFNFQWNIFVFPLILLLLLIYTQNPKSFKMNKYKIKSNNYKK
jgi:hypothetical protein